MERRLWIAAYVFCLFAPLVVLLVGPQRGADKLTLFAVGMGFLTYTGAVLQIVLPSRAPQFSGPLGMPALLRVHRLFGYMVVLFLVIHVAVVVYRDPKYAEWLWPVGQKISAQAGWLAGVALLLIAGTSAWRKRLKLSYEAWRLLHLVLALLILAGGLVHALMSNWYTSIDSLRWLVIALGAAGLIAFVYLRFGRPYASLGASYVLADVIHERGAATTLQLQAVGHGGVPFRPGQFAWIKVQGRPYAITEHPFSYASSAVDPARPSFTVKQLGDATRTFGDLVPGIPVLVDGPHGAHEPPLEGAGHVLIAGGVGITPAMSYIRTHADLRDGAPIRLIYGARNYEDITFREELEALSRTMPLELVFVLSDPDPGWEGKTGFINADLLAEVLPPDADNRNYFVCGPPIMIDLVLAALRALGIDDELVYADRFDSV